MKTHNMNDHVEDVRLFVKNKGAALLLTLLCLTLLSVIAMGLAGMSINQSRISSNHFTAVQAYYVAEAGISRARSELAKNVNWLPPSDFVGTYSLGEYVGSYTLKVTATGSNGKNTYKVWNVESLGQIKDNKGYVISQRKASVVLESESLSRYVMMTDSNPYLWGKSQSANKYSGPMHTNGYFKFYGKPEFDSPLTSSNVGDTCYDGTKQLYKQGATSTSDPSLFYRYVYSYEQDQPVSATGSNNFYFNGGQPAKPLPDTTLDQRQNATEVINGNAVVTMLSSGNIEVICETGNFIFPCDGITIYVKGNVQIEGNVKGSATIVSGGDIYITDNILYSNKTTDSLALVAEDYVILKTEDPNEIRDIEIDAAICALNESFYVDKFYAGQPRGELRIFGALIQKKQGATGVFDFNTGKMLKGFSQNFRLDPKFLAKPPQNIPVSGKIRVKAWKDSGAFQ